jgi:hypothetical protein
VVPISLKVEDAQQNRQMSPVIAHIEGAQQSILGDFFRQVAGLLIRESGL